MFTNEELINVINRNKISSRLFNVWKWGHGFIQPGSVGTTPEGDWEAFINEIKKKLASYNISLLSKRHVSQELPFEIKIPTILNEGAYRLFDAFFYWED